MPAERGAPPRLAVRLVLARLPDEVGEAVAGDLEHEYRTSVRPARGRILADLWFWYQALSLRAHTLRRRARRLRSMRPTWERAGPARARDATTLATRLAMHPHDLRYALRRLARSPGFTAVAVLSLALGIGANTAMFSLVNAVLLRELPVTEPERLVEVYTSDDGGYPYSTSSYADYRDLKARAARDDVFDGVVGTRTFLATIDQEGTARLAFGELVSWDYFDVLGVRPFLGRSFRAEEDDAPGARPVMMLGHQTWTRDHGADPAVLGTTVRMGGLAYTVVGVLPEAFRGSMPVLVTGYFVPLAMTDVVMGGEQLAERGNRSMFLKGRVARGRSLEQVNASLSAFSIGLQESHPRTNESRTMAALPTGDVALHPIVDGALVPVAGLLLGVVGLVLLVACANLASFLLARAEDRRREIAVRLALGAGRGALVRQLLLETVLLALLGGAGGLVLADLTLGLLMGFQPPLPIPLTIDVSLDRTVLLFTGGVSVVAGVAFGLAPALQATNPDVAPALKNNGGVGGSGRRFSLRNTLVVGQVAFSFVLLIGAGLFLRSLQKAQRIDPGFDTGPAAMVWPMPELSGYVGSEAVGLFLTSYEERLLAHPAIDEVARADRLPLGAAVQTGSYVLPDVPSESPRGDHDIDNTSISPGYFETMAVPIVKGRGFEPTDLEAEPVMVVSEAFVERFYPGRDVVGMKIGTMGETEYRIVGVARDTKVRTLGEAPRPFVYTLQGQPTFFGTQFVVRGPSSSAELLAAARQVLTELDPDVVVMDARTMDEHLALMLFPPRMAALLLSVFGGLALVLSAIGIYGTVSHSVARRTRELGIRMSLGASARDVVVMAVGGGMRLVAVGGLAGVALAAAVTWALARFLFGIGPNDVVTFASIPVLLTVVALAAAWVPARRASAVDPVRALRSE